MVDSEEIIVKADRELYTDDEWRELVELGCITRCKECKHYRRVKPNGIRFCTYHGHFANPEDFCAWAEPIEKEERDGSER